MRIVPQSTHATTTHPSLGAPSAPGIHDTLRSNLSLTTPAPTKPSSTGEAPIQLQSTHPLEARLAHWRQTQDALKMSTLRRQFGLAEPVRRGMELSIVRAGEWRPLCLGGMGSAGLHADILSGRDAEIGWEDVYSGEEFREGGFHAEMEGRFGVNW